MSPGIICKTLQTTLPACQPKEEYQHAQADSAGEGWAGEAYEADTLPGGDSSFPKFSKRLQRAPEQCIRYRSVPQPTISRLDVHKKQNPRPPSSAQPVLCFWSQLWWPRPVAMAAASAAVAVQRVRCRPVIRAAGHAGDAHGAGRGLAVAKCLCERQS